MNKKTIVAGVLMDEYNVISFVEVCQKCHITKEQLYEMMDHGLCDAQFMDTHNPAFDEKTVARIQAAGRLQQDLGINLPGIALVLDLVDELEEMRNELHLLRHHISGR